MDLEQVAYDFIERGFFFNLTRTRNKSGVWECRGNPMHSLDYDGDTPYGRADTAEKAIALARKMMPKE
jgi:hypothetical protein